MEAPIAERGKRRKSVARRVSSRRATIEEPFGSEEESENPFNDRDLIKRLIDGCILPEVIERINHADPEQRIWDSLGSFLKVNKSSFNRLFDRCSDPLVALADWAPAPHQYRGDEPGEEGRHPGGGALPGRGHSPQKKAAEVVALQEALKREKQARGEEKQTLEEMVRKTDRKSTRLNSSHSGESRMPSSA